MQNITSVQESNISRPNFIITNNGLAESTISVPKIYYIRIILLVISYYSNNEANDILEYCNTFFYINY